MYLYSTIAAVLLGFHHGDVTCFAFRACAFVEGDSVHLHFFARDLGFAAALHGLVGFFVICHRCTDWKCA